jgi:hypothetical protein
VRFEYSKNFQFGIDNGARRIYHWRGSRHRLDRARAAARGASADTQYGGYEIVIEHSLTACGGFASFDNRQMAVHAQRAAAWSARRLSRASIENAATTKTGETMTEPAEKSELIVYENVDTAPFVYFDISPTHGILGGAIQIELAARILNAVPDGSVEIKFITTGRLRCSPTAALNLRHAIDAALKMLEQPQQSPVAAAKMN